MKICLIKLKADQLKLYVLSTTKFEKYWYYQKWDSGEIGTHLLEMWLYIYNIYICQVTISRILLSLLIKTERIPTLWSKNLTLNHLF